MTLSAVPLLVGGASVLLGVKPKLGAMALLGFLAGVSPIMHDFWRDEDPDTRMNNMIMFMKNLALAGGALALMGVEEPWEASVPGANPRCPRRRGRSFVESQRSREHAGASRLRPRAMLRRANAQSLLAIIGGRHGPV